MSNNEEVKNDIKNDIKYTSIYTDNEITAAQKIAETICVMKAAQDKKELPKLFWNLPHWKNYYRQQLFAANSLLKLYSYKVIMESLRDKRLWKLYSLRAPFLDNILKEYAYKEQLAQKTKEIREEVEKENSAPIVVVNDNNPRPTFAPKSSISKLREFE